MNNTTNSIVFLDFDDVLAISKVYSSYQVREIFKSGALDTWPELWDNLFFQEGKANLAALHANFKPRYVLSTSWSTFLTREQFVEIFKRTGLDFLAESLHDKWTTPKGSGGAGRLEEICRWLEIHLQEGEVVLVLDDEESGWSLLDSHLEDEGKIVICTPWVGFVGAKLQEAFERLDAQMHTKP